jgi:hypothetical protein
MLVLSLQCSLDYPEIVENIAQGLDLPPGSVSLNLKGVA